MLPSKKVKAHLYLEGVEIDFSSLTINESAGSPPTAVVSIPPVLHIYNILPKTVCVITAEVEARNPETGETIEDSNGKKMFDEVVLFFGELRAYGLNRTAAAAEVELTFNGFTDNWTTTPIVPVDSTIPTLAQSQIVGVNYYRPKSSENDPEKVEELYKSFGIYYRGFPTLLMGFADLLTKEAPGDTTPMLRTISINYGREDVQKRLLDYAKKHAKNAGEMYEKLMNKRFDVSATSPAALKTALQYMTKHFLLNYGQFSESMTKSLTLDTFINYIGSTVTKSYFKNVSVVNYLRNNLQQMGGTISIHDALRRILPFMRYQYQEFASPIVTPDTSGGGMILNKVLFSPRPELFSPIVNNTIFDDNIVSASFARDLSKEPTRLIRLATPLLTQNQDSQSLLQVTLATIMPHDVVVGSKLTNMADKAMANLEKIAKIAAVRGNIDDADLEDKIKTWTQDSYLKAQKDAEAAQAEGRALTQAEKDQLDKAWAIAQDVDKLFNKDATGKTEFEELKKNLENLRIFDLSKEEKLRGVIPDVYSDDSGIEYAFLLDALNKKQPGGKTYATYTDFVNDDSATKVTDSHEAVLAELNNKKTKEDALSRYYSELADYTYREHRRKSRVLNLQTDYSPYRVCGYTGTVFIKDIGTMVGVLSSISSRINSNGEATQSLNFTHMAILSSDNSLATTSDYLDHYTDGLPGYLSEFTVDKVGKNVYTYVSGRNNASLFEYATKVLKNPIEGYELTPGIETVDSAIIVGANYDLITDAQTLEKFVHKLTWRNLATYGELMAVLKNTEKGFTPRPAAETVTFKNAPRPFVKERQDVIMKIFKAVQPDIKVWKDPEGIL